MLETRPKEIVRVIATTKKYERAPWFIAPLFGSDRKPIYSFLDKAEPALSSEEKAAMIESLGWDAESAEEVRHLQNLNLALDRDYAVYLWLLNACDEVATSKEAAKPAKHRFYIENKELEASTRVDTISIKMKALQIAQEIIRKGDEHIKDSCRLLAIPVKGLTRIQIQDAFLAHADGSPKAFLTKLDDKYRDYKIFIVKLLERGLIGKSRSGSFFHGEQKNVIAINETQMIGFLQDKVNTNLINMWAQEVGSMPAEGKSTKEEVSNMVGRTSSHQLNVSKAVDMINTLKSIEDIDLFIEGDVRPAVTKAAQAKRDSLTETV
jgi:hypothetical protein